MINSQILKHLPAFCFKPLPLQRFQFLYWGTHCSLVGVLTKCGIEDTGLFFNNERTVSAMDTQVSKRLPLWENEALSRMSISDLAWLWGLMDIIFNIVTIAPIRISVTTFLWKIEQCWAKVLCVLLTRKKLFISTCWDLDNKATEKAVWN